MGRELRRRVPRSSLGDWSAPADRPDPVQLITESHRGRLARLIPYRVGLMTATPYGFLRGTAIVMAEDVARLPATGITPVICGDAHLGNFGFYASPEQDLVIDLNDIHEAHPGGCESDLRRLRVQGVAAEYGRDPLQHQVAGCGADCGEVLSKTAGSQPSPAARVFCAPAAAHRLRATASSTISTQSQPRPEISRMKAGPVPASAAVM
jgi:hypothetical protein